MANKRNSTAANARKDTYMYTKNSDCVQTERVEPRTYAVKEIDPTQYVVVRSGYQGSLTYKSSRTGEKFKWPEFGSDQEMELRELRNAKSAHKKFFINNWFMFDEPWVIDYLGVGQYYKNAINIDHFDDIFTLSPDEIKTRVGELSAGQKKSVAYRARVLISEGEIDSNKVIAALEETLGVELVER